MRKLSRYLLVLFLLTVGLLLVQPTLAESPLVVYTSLSDAYLHAWDLGGGYTVVHDYEVLDGDNGDVYDDYNLYIGQKYWVGLGYDIYRTVLYFDTAEIPDTAIIDSVTLQFRTAGIWGSGYSLEVVDGTGIADPLVGAAYGTLLNRTTSGGSLESIESSTTYEVPLNSTGISWINKTGLTVLGLRTDKDINATTPTGLEYFCIEPRDWEPFGGLEAVPQLIISYTVPPPIHPVYTLAGVLPYAFAGICLVAAAVMAFGGATLSGIVMLAVAIIVALTGTNLIQMLLP